MNTGQVDSEALIHMQCAAVFVLAVAVHVRVIQQYMLSLSQKVLQQTC